MLFRKKYFLSSNVLKISRSLSFMNLDIEPLLSRQLRNAGIKTPTDIQKLSIPAILHGKNCVINSETGSGKTLAYTIPLVQKILNDRKNGLKGPFGLILVPNNELVVQVNNVLKDLAVIKSKVASEYSPLQLKSTDVIISTASHILTYPLNVFDNLKTVVIDEADFQITRKVGKHGMKDPLFKIIHYFLNEDILKIKDMLKLSSSCEDESTKSNKSNVQFVFVGATLPNSSVLRSKHAMSYIKKWLPNIDVIQSNAHKLAPNVDMKFIDVLSGNKFKLLTQILSRIEYLDKKIIIFSNHFDTVNMLFKYLQNYNLSEGIGTSQNLDYWKDTIYTIHRNQNLEERLKVINEFSNMSSGVLISSDVISRGFDIPNVDVVIQYDFAKNVIDALHRVGRTARNYQFGEVINFVTDEDRIVANAFQEAFNEDKPLDDYFSRKRSLRKRVLSESL